MRIYRVLGSVAFLNSGKTLHPILAKSQCWCVDGQSKFVLRIRPNSYYRIELPYGTSEDKAKVEELKSILSTILQFETTPCPFKRGFTVDLPALPKTPIQRRPWTPKAKLEATPSTDFGELGNLVLTAGRTNPPPRPSGKEQTADHVKGKLISNSKDGSEVDAVGSSEEESGSEHVHANGSETYTHHVNLHKAEVETQLPIRPKSLRTGRAITAPPHLILSTLPPSDSVTDASCIAAPEKSSPSLSSSLDSFHSFHSPISPLAPPNDLSDHVSPPEESWPSMKIPRSRNHRRDISDITVTASSSDLWDMTSASSGDDITEHSPPDAPGTPTLISDGASQDEDPWSEAVTPSPTREIRHRFTKSKRRTQSPLPSSVNLYSPYSPRSHMSGHHLTTAILQRTCSILLGPPVQLVALMLRIAAKLAKGAMRGTSYGFGEGGQRIPCSWDFSDGSDDNDEFEEDDYGVVLTKVPSFRDAKAKEVGGSWEID